MVVSANPAAQYQAPIIGTDNNDMIGGDVPSLERLDRTDVLQSGSGNETLLGGAGQDIIEIALDFGAMQT